MRRRNCCQIFWLWALLALAAAACGLPATATPAAPPQMQTAAALTVQAVLSNTPLPTPTRAPQNTAPAVTITSPTGTTSTPGTGSPTSSSGQAKLTVEDVTNCRGGPGTGYPRITQIPGGKEVNIVGSYPGYWLVQSEAGPCWITMEFSTPSGDIARVPTVTQPATPSAGPPTAPSLARYDYFCNGQGQIELSLRWTDKSSNESGFRVYINGKGFAELPADTTEYSLSFDRNGTSSATFNIEAFNQGGQASTSVVTITC